MGSEGSLKKEVRSWTLKVSSVYNSKAGSRVLASEVFISSRAKMPAFADDRQIAEMINPSFIAALTLAKEVLDEGLEWFVRLGFPVKE